MAGETIKRLRVEAGLTQKQLAELTGHTQQSISQYEKGTRNIDYNTLKRICDVLNAEIKIERRTGA
ncbi:helix-turn-helix domain-containing protein [Robertmurraya andreesenii]|uniref:Transcriptional regulator with XRE-family HTH domain n=1 Tax=Anoxybacillus andreesenii TaxID=1325932 RepID=A0ABT9V1Y9_9BACL|nr:helix-turn-helix transcriptional regulator [Robertmurraya andreesenii]MDQ0154971.1 transcriptional regulator with XRE-family HTH domain [Robertmurraya andreesenii]